ncbi:copper amine oxidase N-terminal domain-containing protein, partial [Brevibacillus borstelensis]|uniref:copper amine oxidase N-terminal domain-containing protein n=1 Tax=Brevibacillus borstelensis TaxID=45462 RepID=UPI002E1FC862|nr:copper amine oxidase N-terminal domain-containing protein [Brevibacillus borstelensis]
MTRTKSFLIASLIASVTFCSVPPVFATQQPVSVNETSKTISISIDDKKIQFDVQPFIKQDSFGQEHVMVPLKSFVEALGGRVETWKRENASGFTVTKDDVKISIMEGQQYQFLNDYMVLSGTEPVYNNSQLFVPLKFISIALGAEIQSNTDNQITLKPNGKVKEAIKDTKGYILSVSTLKNYHTQNEATLLKVMGDDLQYYSLLVLDKDFKTDKVEGKRIVFSGDPDSILARYTLLNDSKGDVIRTIGTKTIKEINENEDPDISSLHLNGVFTGYLGMQSGSYVYSFKTAEGKKYTVVWASGATKVLPQFSPYNYLEVVGYSGVVSGYKTKSSNVVILREIKELGEWHQINGNFTFGTLKQRINNKDGLQVYKGALNDTDDSLIEFFFKNGHMINGYTTEDLTGKSIIWSGVSSEEGKVNVESWLLAATQMNDYGTVISIKEQDNNRVVYTLKPKYSSFTEITFDRTILGNKYPETSLIGKEVIVSGDVNVNQN